MPSGAYLPVVARYASTHRFHSGASSAMTARSVTTTYS